MNSSSPHCVPSADGAFGPMIDAECRDGSDFTIAFEQSILVLLPASLLLLAAPFRLVQLRNAPVKVAGHRLRHLKLAAIAILATLHLALVVLWATQPPGARFSPVSVAAACVSLASSLVSCVLSYAEHVKSPRPSSLLNAFLLVSLLLDAALLRTLWLLPSSTVHASLPAVFTAAFSLKAALVVLEAWDKSAYLVARAGPYAPEVTAGLYARAVFAWVTPLLNTGFRRLLKPVDLFALDEDMGAAGLVERFWWYWKKAPSNHNYRLIRCCIVTLRWSLVAVVIPRLALLAFTICQPLALNRFLVFLDDSSQPAAVGHGLVAAYGLIYFGIAITQALYWHRNGRSATMLRGVLVSAIFSKATETSIAAADDSAAVTLMSSDVEVIVRAVKEIHEFWANVIQIAIATWLLSIQIGYAASGPIIVSFLALLATIGVAPLAKKYQVAWLQKTQKRVGITSAMIGHIKSIKMSGLAQKLSDTIANLRVEEIKASKPFRVVGSITSSIAQVPLLLSPVLAFAMFQGVTAQSDQTLDATRLFSALSLVILLAQPLFWMFEAVLDMSAALGAFDRIQKFLVQGSRQDYRQVHLPVVPETPHRHSSEAIELQVLRNNMSASPISAISEDIAIDVRGADLAWSEERKILHDVTFTVKRGQFGLLLGPVASGKSTLLKGLLGEVPNTTGRVSLTDGPLSWCDQTPWLLNKSIRENIIGYSHFDPSFFDTVVKACDLEKDFQQLSQGDMTLIGSKGLALSGGQKQRVALARAVYSKPQVALFDDVFSGLDNHTAQRVFKNVFDQNGLLRRFGTTVILATQSSSFLSSADLFLCLEGDGKLSEQRTLDHLRDSGEYTKALVKNNVGFASSDHGDSIELVERNNATGDNPKDKPAKDQQLDKRRQLGDRAVYRYYFGSIGYSFVYTLIALEIVWAFLESFPTVWLKFWTDADSEGKSHSAGYYLGVYAALQLVGVIWFATLIWFVLVHIAARSGISLHHKLLWTVMKAPLSLFTTTDIGSITTRFSQDIGMVDNHLPLGLVVTLASFFGVIAKAGLLAASSYYVAISFPFLFALYFYLQRGYLRTSRQLRLLDLEEKAPVYTQFIEMLGGLATLRAFGWAPAAIEANHILVDRSQRPFYLLIMVQRWLVLVLDLTTAALALLVVGFAVMLRGDVDVGLTGVSLVQLIGLSGTLNMLIQFWTSIETSIGAVARIKQFAEETREESLPGETQEPPKAWPDRGEIQIKSLTASYETREEVKVLDGISLDIKAGEKVGICGRTGSGKSSLLLALLRLLDYSSGAITVDGLPLASLPRQTIRTRFIAITQDQFVLPGTVNENIDPFHTSSTHDIIEALRLVGLWDTLEERGGLDAPFEEDMLSHGQRQLFFLARAVLRKAVGRVVLLDEATSSVDQKTEEAVKKVIKTQFRAHTVVSIAHRLDTIVDFDRVIVMEHGNIVEVGKPNDLLTSKSKFKALWDANLG
ncbi:P-loop containing nucleoside triphosphate hydrolase protein [Dactylonectria estremocensis]|uniref:P-loop containing nucleoside triphosphate hydrolase protein n=1 Tax=Dactylonectria estremocensis TaxID=1079267 RepID=A0A9P9EUX9_9HYPO|nr:P-loop containing nucleoside triphosphate hydrolase protein [Dactylonectria estremocensis]